MDTSGCLTAAPKASTQDDGSAYGSSVAHSILFKLPRELRDYIYEYAFCGPRFHITKHGGIPEPALLVTCKIVRDEAISTFYNGEKRLLLVVDSYYPAVLQLWSKKYEHLARTRAIFASKINHRHAGIGNWDNLKRALQLRHANEISSLNASPVGSPKFTDESFFIMGLFRMTGEMEDRSWEAVEAVFDMIRPGLVKLHHHWGL